MRRDWTRTIFLRGADEDYTMSTKGRMLERLRVILAGRAAEEVRTSHFRLASVLCNSIKGREMAALAWSWQLGGQHVQDLRNDTLVPDAPDC